jgi:hypothetical protein
MTKSHTPRQIRAFIKRNYVGPLHKLNMSIGQLGQLYYIHLSDKHGNEFMLKHTVAEVDKY